MKIVACLVLFLTSAVAYSGVFTHDVIMYICDKTGAVPPVAREWVEFKFKPGVGVYVAEWNVPGVGQPAVFPPRSDDSFIVYSSSGEFVYDPSGFWRKKNTQEVQSEKTEPLKASERQVIQFLRTEGAIAAGDKQPTLEQLDAMFESWEALPGAAGDAKASRYERLMRRVRLLGGSDLDVYDHPVSP